MAAGEGALIQLRIQSKYRAQIIARPAGVECRRLAQRLGIHIDYP